MLRAILTNSGWWLTERLTTIALSAATSIVLTRALGPGAYGHLSYLLAIVGLLTRQALAEVVLIRSVRPDWRFDRRA